MESVSSTEISSEGTSDNNTSKKKADTKSDTNDIVIRKNTASDKVEGDDRGAEKVVEADRMESEKPTNIMSNNKKSDDENKINFKSNEKSRDKLSNSQNDVEDEDVPQDFFDDFSNPDFMEGLNIVDAWDDQPSKDDPSDSNENDKYSSEKTVRSKVDDRRVKRRKSSELRLISKSRNCRKRSRDRKRQSESDEVHSKRKSSSDPKKDKLKDESDLRRDPIKTKRDLEKYKVKCDKDKEQKSISEKLKVVETGLVPPGMEMDVDLDEVMKQVQEEKKEKCPELDDSWRSHPTAKSTKTVYPDLKPSAVLSTEAKLDPKRKRRPSKNKPKRKSSEYIAIGDSPLPEVGLPQHKRQSPSSERKRQKIRGSRSKGRSVERKRRSPSMEKTRRPIRVMSPGRYEALTKSPIRHIPDQSVYSRENVYVRRSISRENEPRPRSRNRRSTSRSRYPRRRRSRSLSEREAWMRDPKRSWRRSRSRNRGRSRSRSPKRNRQDDKKEKKISFLEEIHQLLTGGAPNSAPQMLRPPHIAAHPLNMMPVPVAAPLPVPPPHSIPQFQFQPQPQYHPPVQHRNPSFDRYDQQFFIGDAPVHNAPLPASCVVDGLHPVIPPPVPQPNIPLVTPQLEPNKLQNNQNVQIVPPSKLETQIQNDVSPKLQPQSIPSPMDILAKIKSIVTETTKPAAKDEIQKLYDEKKISLSDFLTMTTKIEDFPTSSTSTTNLPKKIQVISRCQDVVKQLEGGILQGRFILERKPRVNSPQEKNRSPLSVKALVYESTTSSDISHGDFRKTINRVLSSSGLSAITSEEEGDEESKVKSQPLIAPPAPSLTPTIKSMNAKQRSRSLMAPLNTLPKMVQTEPFKCQTCEERNDTIYIHVASQCSVSVRSIAIQTEDPVKEILKSKPLAALTPAQLLMKDERETDSRFALDEIRHGLLGSNNDYRFKMNYNRDRDIRISPPPRNSFSPPRLVYSPPRSHFSPTRGHFSPPRRFGSPVRDRSPYVPGGPIDPLPKRHMFPLESFNNPRIPFPDGSDRFYRR